MIYLELFLGFLKVGCFAFGGAYGAIPLIRDVVMSYGWLSDEKLAYIYGDAALAFQKSRYLDAIDRYFEIYGDAEISLFTVSAFAETTAAAVSSQELSIARINMTVSPEHRGNAS